MTTADDLAWLNDDDCVLGDIYCLTFVRGLDETEALHRLGTDPGTVRPRIVAEFEPDDFYAAAELAFAVRLGDWTLVIEPGGFQGSLVAPARALSRGTELVSVLRHDYAASDFERVADGEIFDRYEPIGNEEITEALLKAVRLTGVAPTPELLTRPLTSAEVRPLLDDPPTPESLDHHALRWHGPFAGAVDAAPDEVRRAVALAEARRLGALAGVDAEPAFAAALAAAERGEPYPVDSHSPFGLVAREWNRLSDIAGRSLNDPGSTLTDDERNLAHARMWAVRAVRGALAADSRVAAYEALAAIRSFASKQRQDEILRVLHGDQPIGSL